MQPRIGPDRQHIGALPPQNERSQFAPKRIDQPQTLQKKHVQAVASKDQQFTKKISLWQSMRKMYPAKQCCQQVFETDMHFYPMFYRLVLEFTFLLPFVCFANKLLAGIMVVLYTGLSLCKAFDGSQKFVLLVRLLKINQLPANQAFQNWFLVLEFFYFFGCFVFGMTLCNAMLAANNQLEFFENYKAEFGVFGQLFTVANVYHLFTTFVHKRNLRLPHQISFHENMYLGRKVLPFGEFALNVAFEKEIWDLDTTIKMDYPEAKRREGMDYNE